MSNNTDERYVAMARDVIHVRFELLKIFEMFNNAFTMRLLIPISSQKIGILMWKAWVCYELHMHVGRTGYFCLQPHATT